MEQSASLRRNNVNVAGNPEAGKMLVFVHGFGTDQDVWSAVTPAFADSYRLVLLDNAGAGDSDVEAFERASARYLTLRGYAEDLVEVGQLLELRDATLVGHSVGGMISLLASLQNPAMFSRLVLIAASPRYLNDTGYHGGFTEDMLSGIHMAMYQNYQDWTKTYAMSAMAHPEKPELHEYFARHLSGIPFSRAAKILFTILKSDHRADLGKVSVPTLIIQSGEDIAVPHEVADYMHRHIPHSRLAHIDATGHLPHLSDPQAVIAAMREFGI
ncbi:alpha/beta hydrolase [uncultured Azonexus sp.]|uniref:alpha/beta fold hydrolase n=1 Tax=uncultured Azonexus sp. TaxID=520307 RepID=UPI002631321E|nr:alpha/beta hydrolase [uncultured Azonexus sp.]